MFKFFLQLVIGFSVVVSGYAQNSLVEISYGMAIPSGKITKTDFTFDRSEYAVDGWYADITLGRLISDKVGIALTAGYFLFDIDRENLQSDVNDRSGSYIWDVRTSDLQNSYALIGPYAQLSFNRFSILLKGGAGAAHLAKTTRTLTQVETDREVKRVTKGNLGLGYGASIGLGYRLIDKLALGLKFNFISGYNYREVLVSQRIGTSEGTVSSDKVVYSPKNIQYGLTISYFFGGSDDDN